MEAEGMNRRELIQRGGALGGLLALSPLLPGVAGTAAAEPAAAGADGAAGAAASYDLLLTGGHLIDPKNKINGVRDVAIKDGRIARVAAKINSSTAAKTLDVRGKYVTPGIIDMHAHLFPGPADAYAAGKNGVAPDGFTFRCGVTTAVDAGSPGAANFRQFKAEIIDRSKTRVLAFLNIVGKGMAGGSFEQDLGDMRANAAARVAKLYPEEIVGIKTAHYSGPEWAPVDRSVQAGQLADLPVMVDFGSNRPQRPLYDLLTEHLRPGDIYTHVFSGLRGELGEDGKLNPGIWEGRKRGILFDVGHGGGSFGWDIAIPALDEGFLPDTISTDLHIDSMNSGMKDMANSMSKMLAVGMPLREVIAASTWRVAKSIRRTELGHLSSGAAADVAVFDLTSGDFGYADSFGMRVRGEQKLIASLTLRDGEVVWDLDGLNAEDYVPGKPRPRTFDLTAATCC